MTPINLEDVLQPCSPDEFLGAAWGKTFRHIPGEPEKFQGLLSWSGLNTLLQQNPLDYPRIRVFIDGACPPSREYLDHCQTLNGYDIPRLNPARLNALLRRGGLLIVEAIDAMVPAIARLAESFERTLREPFQASVYANWGMGQGGGSHPHVDACDVFALQVIGRKRWRIYGPSAAASASRNGKGDGRPPAEPVWDHVLEPGDLLYLPEGWWHDADPVGEPTLHLLLGCRSRTGLDYLRWVEHQVEQHPLFGARLPRTASPAEQAEHMVRLRAALLAAWDAHPLTQYLALQDGLATPRPRLSLPWSALPTPLPPADDACVQWTAPRPVSLQDGRDASVIELWANGEKWEFARAAEAVLCPLLEGRPLSIAELCDRARGRLDRERVRSLLGQLLVHGLVALADSLPPSGA